MKSPDEIADILIATFDGLSEENDGNEITYWCRQYDEPNALADQLSEILGIDRNEIFKLL